MIVLIYDCCYPKNDRLMNAVTMHTKVRFGMLNDIMSPLLSRHSAYVAPGSKVINWRLYRFSVRANQSSQEVHCSSSSIHGLCKPFLRQTLNSGK